MNNWPFCVFVLRILSLNLNLFYLICFMPVFYFTFILFHYFLLFINTHPALLVNYELIFCTMSSLFYFILCFIFYSHPQKACIGETLYIHHIFVNVQCLRFNINQTIDLSSLMLYWRNDECFSMRKLFRWIKFFQNVSFFITSGFVQLHFKLRSTGAVVSCCISLSLPIHLYLLFLLRRSFDLTASSLSHQSLLM